MTTERIKKSKLAKKSAKRKSTVTVPRPLKKTTKKRAAKRTSAKKLSAKPKPQSLKKGLQVALAQVNPTLGDFEYNANLILNNVKLAVDKGAELVVFPEASLFGYHPVDLLVRRSIVDEQLKHLAKIVKMIPSGVRVLIGAITLNPNRKGKPYQNSAVLLQKNKKPKVFAKQLLPAYDVFDEGRHIEPGWLVKNTFSMKGKKIQVTICEDIWGWPDKKTGQSPYLVNPLDSVKAKDIDLVVNLSASPFSTEKHKQRQIMCKNVVNKLKAPMVYVNMVGAQDEIIYDGKSMVFDHRGQIHWQGASHQEDLVVFDMFNLPPVSGKVAKVKPMTDLRRSLVLGIKDFVAKTGIGRVHMGLSGGIDSAVVLALAHEALGSDAVSAIALPGPFNAPESLSLAETMCKNLGVEFIEMPIAPIYEQGLEVLQDSLGIKEFSLVHENLQARIRGTLLMGFSNTRRSLLLNTGNKTEMATGYSTLYGDQVGGLCPIADLLKHQVYDLAQDFNKESEVIPQRIIDRPPTAELRPNQVDQDSLPAYDVLDKLVLDLVVNQKVPQKAEAKKVLLMLMNSEFKRWQAPPILKVSSHAFGRGRRFPIAHKARF